MATVRTRKRGKTFSYIFEAGKTADGRRRVIEKGGFPTKEAAYEAGVAAFTDWKHGDIGITSERVTVKDFLAAWMNRIKGSVRSTTYGTYETNLNNNILPYLGATILQDLTPAQLDRWMLRLRDKNLSRSTIHIVRALLSQALDFAVYPCQILRDNPCRYLKAPKTDGGRHVKRVIVTQEAFDGLLEEFPPGTDYYLPLLLLYHTGMRIGEVLGLCWEDIDFEQGTLTVSRQRVYDKAMHMERVTDPKTKTSKRQIFLADFMLSILQEEKRVQEENERQLGKSFCTCRSGEDGRISSPSKDIDSALPRLHLVCIKKNGRPVSRSGLTRMLRAHHLNSHSFRHTQATRLASDGLPPSDVAARLGHATTKTTLDTYTHSTQEQQKRIADKLEEAYWNAFFDS